jgi:hypothetical protein
MISNNGKPISTPPAPRNIRRREIPRSLMPFPYHRSPDFASGEVALTYTARGTRHTARGRPRPPENPSLPVFHSRLLKPLCLQPAPQAAARCPPILEPDRSAPADLPERLAERLLHPHFKIHEATGVSP